jgi:hypothetical protein
MKYMKLTMDMGLLRRLWYNRSICAGLMFYAINQSIALIFLMPL